MCRCAVKKLLTHTLLTTATFMVSYLLTYSHHRLVGCVEQLAERRSLAGEQTLSCTRPSANGWPLCG